jgi:1,2-dihydroxy-3-keto-5-methylthiopentene dioxygenase
MAILRIPEEDRSITDAAAVAARLAQVGIDYERWEPAHPVAAGASADEVLKAYEAEIEKLKARGGYVTADVIDVTAATPGLDAMLAKFSREHWHDEDEVRFILRGRGLFHIRPREGAVLAIEVEAGDLIRVPRGTWHWFDLCETRDIRAIRLFQDPAGWAPHYTESGAEKGFEPVCLGPTQIPPAPPSL